MKFFKTVISIVIIENQADSSIILVNIKLRYPSQDLRISIKMIIFVSFPLFAYLPLRSLTGAKVDLYLFIIEQNKMHSSQKDSTGGGKFAS